ncbi:MAG: ComF family protein [Chloroflexi bacterium]|nr:ComF family protein [Chloroflexota bacterium]
MLSRIIRHAQPFQRALIDLLFPPRCVTCKRIGNWFCQDCLASCEIIPTPICEHCGRHLLTFPCAYCKQFPLVIDGTRAIYFFETKMRGAIHAFKYEKRVELAAILAARFDAYLREQHLPFDVVVPVPLHAERERARGYNQSLLLARELQARRGCEVWSEALTRVRVTLPQVELDAAARRVNVADAFTATARVRHRQILLIDDVLTTGATMDACAVALKQAGAQSVWGLALARGR